MYPLGLGNVKRLQQRLRYRLLSGQAMAGAGGGGFIFVLTKEPNMVDEVKAVIKEMQVMFRCPH